MVLFSPAYKIFWNLQELTGRKKNLFGRHSPHFNNRIFLTENCHILNFSIYGGCKYKIYNMTTVVFSVPHLLWHGASFYNGHLHGPVTVTPIAEPSLPVFTTNVCRIWDSNTQPSACSVYRCTEFFFKNKTLYNLKILDKIYIIHFLLKIFLREMVEASLWGSLSLMPSYGYFWLSDIICIFSVIWNIQQVFFMDFFLQFNCMSTSN